MGILKIDSVTDSGESKYLEDGFVVIPGTFLVAAVCDGYSIPYDDNNPIKLFGGFSSGEWIRGLFCEIMSLAATRLPSLFETIAECNLNIRSFHEPFSPGLNASELAGLTFASVRVDSRFVTIAQGGDCTVVYRSKNGSVGFTPNTAKPASIRDRAKKAELLRLCDGDKKGMRVEFTSYLKEEKNRNINNPESPEGYPTINGYLNWAICFQKAIPVSDIDFLLLFTDGFLSFDWFNEPDRMEELVNVVRKHGVQYQLRQIRESGQTTEATAVAVWLD